MRSWVLVAVFLPAMACAGGLDGLCPQPQEIQRKGEETLESSEILFVYPGSHPETSVLQACDRSEKRLKNRLQKRMWARPGDPVPLPGMVGADTLSGWEALADLPSPLPDLMKAVKDLPAEGYGLEVTPQNIWIVGKDSMGVVYGLATLSQLLSTDSPISCVRILDHPDFPFRAAYANGFQKMDGDVRRIAERLVDLKYNALVMESCAFYQLEDESVRKGVTEVFEFLRSLGLEPIPELQSFGWSQCILSQEPQCAEGLRWEDRRFVFKTDVAEPFIEARPDPVLVNADFSVEEENSFEGWTQDDVGTTQFAGTDQDPSRGRCIRIERSTPGVSRLSQTVECSPNTDYVVDVDMKTQAGQGFSAYFEVYGNKGVADNRIFIAYPGVTSTTDWTRRRLHLNSGPSDQLTLYLRIQDGVGQAWFDNVSLRFSPPLGLVNLIRAKEAPVTVTDDSKTKTYEEGKDYEILPGQTLYGYLPENEPWRLRRLAGGAIAPGQEVRVSYDYAPADSITYCPSDPRTQDIMKASLEKTIEVLHPRYLHIGHDEPRFINRDSRCKAQRTTATQLFTDDINRFYQWVKAKDPSVTLMMWSDALRTDAEDRVQLAWHSKEKDSLESVAARIPKDILQGPWEYSKASPEFHERMLTSLLDQGYQVSASPWYTLSNVYSWVEAARKIHPARPGLLGLFLTTWDNRWEADAMVAEYNWSLSKPVFDSKQPDFEKVLSTHFSRVP